MLRIKPRYRDYINVLSKVTLYRALNLIKLQASYLSARFLKTSFIRGLPWTISIEPTTSCNLRCPECPSGLRQFSRNTGMMKLDDFKAIIDQIHKELIYLLLYFQGEPYLNPEFFDFVEYAGKKRIYTATSTNAHFLGEENARKTVQSGLDRLIVSLDGIGQESYAQYRVGGRYEKVVEGIRNVVKWKKELRSAKPFIIVQFIVFRSNEHQLGEVRSLCRELGVDELQFKTAQINDYENGSPLIPENDRYSRYRKRPDGTYEFRNSLPNRCNRMWSGNVITWDGLVVPCCFDKDAKYKLGNLKESEFREIWKDVKYREFRKKVFTGRRDIDICRNCTEGMKL